MPHENEEWSAYGEGEGCVISFIGLPEAIQLRNVGVQLYVSETYAVRTPRNSPYAAQVRALVRQQVSGSLLMSSDEVVALQKKISPFSTPADITFVVRGAPKHAGLFQLEFKADEQEVILHPVNVDLKKREYAPWLE